MKYELDKRIWTDEDFGSMGWHDCRIYKMRSTKDLELDIDYIFQWNEPDIEGLPFTFWIAPSTLLFKNITNLTFEIDTVFEESIEIESIERIQNDKKVQWTIITHQGDFEFESEGYEQFIRQEP